MESATAGSPGNELGGYGSDPSGEPRMGTHRLAKRGKRRLHFAIDRFMDRRIVRREPQRCYRVKILL
jgi:hypothetical protein